MIQIQIDIDNSSFDSNRAANVDNYQIILLLSFLIIRYFEEKIDRRFDSH